MDAFMTRVSKTKTAVRINRLIFGALAILFSEQSFSYAFKDGCLDSSWIAIRTDKAKECPSAPSWSESVLFERNSRVQNSSLDRFCRYDRLLVGTTPSTQAVPPELEQLIIDELIEDNLQQDCLVVGSLATTATDVLSAMEKQFLRQTGKSSLPTIPSQLHPVRMAIIDTLPTNEYAASNLTTRSPHGASMAAIAHRLLCENNSDNCYAHLTSQLALAYVGRKKDKDYHVYRDDFQGGFFGSLSDLARAIRNEVIAWKENEPYSSLVINLSIGWNGDSWGGNESLNKDYSASVKSVYKAIEDARCRGALIISAAGNKGKDSSDDLQAMLPARWETLPQPSRKRCQSLIGEGDLFDEEAEGSLVYGISGIDSSNLPLTNSRPKANSRIVAYGDHAAIDTSITNKSETVTGSSVATVVVSGAASMVWAYRPDLTATQVMNLIYESGEKLNFDADFYLNTVTPDILSKRTSMCSALTLACDGLTCNGPRKCTRSNIAIDLQSTSLVTSPATSYYSLTSLEFCSSGDPDCKINETGSAATAPWTIPQPDSNVCPNCIHTQLQNALILQSPITYSGEISETLLIKGNDVYTLPEFALGDKVMIDHFPLSSATETVLLSFLINEDHRVTVPILFSQ